MKLSVKLPFYLKIDKPAIRTAEKAASDSLILEKRITSNESEQRYFWDIYFCPLPKKAQKCIFSNNSQKSIYNPLFILWGYWDISKTKVTGDYNSTRLENDRPLSILNISSYSIVLLRFLKLFSPSSCIFIYICVICNMYV